MSTLKDTTWMSLKITKKTKKKRKKIKSQDIDLSIRVFGSYCRKCRILFYCFDHWIE